MEKITNDKTLFAMDLTAMMAVEQLSAEKNNPRKKFCLILWNQIQQKCFMLIQQSFGGMVLLRQLKNIKKIIGSSSNAQFSFQIYS